MSQIQTLGLLIAHQQRVETCQQNTFRQFLLRNAAVFRVEIRSAAAFSGFDRQFIHPRAHVTLRRSKEIRRVLNCCRSVVREVPSCQFHLRRMLFHGRKRRAAAVCLLLLHQMTDFALLTQRADETAPWVKRTFGFFLTHAFGKERLFQRLTLAYSSVDTAKKQVRQLALAVGRAVCVVQHCVARAQEMRPAPVQNERQITLCKNMHCAAHGPAFHQSAGIWRAACADRNGVQRVCQKLRLYSA